MGIGWHNMFYVAIVVVSLHMSTTLRLLDACACVCTPWVWDAYFESCGRSDVHASLHTVTKANKCLDAHGMAWHAGACLPKWSRQRHNLVQHIGVSQLLQAHTHGAVNLCSSANVCSMCTYAVRISKILVHVAFCVSETVLIRSTCLCPQTPMPFAFVHLATSLLKALCLTPRSTVQHALVHAHEARELIQSVQRLTACPRSCLVTCTLEHAPSHQRWHTCF